MSLYALTIVAHPDDESFLFAGTTLKFEEEGNEVAVICATRGEKGADRLNRPLSEEQMAEIRTKELHVACGILGCVCKKFFNFKDGNLDNTDINLIASELAEQLEELKPQIIMTFGAEGISGHRDHVTIHKAVLAALERVQTKPKELWLAGIPASMIEDFRNHMHQRKVHHSHFVKNDLQGVPDEKLTQIDISKFRDKKLAAIKAHESQYVPHLTWEPFLESEWFEIIKLP